MKDEFEGFGVPRAFACVVRDSSQTPELLAFRHPLQGVQIPKGRIDVDETPREAALRELWEESGLSLDDPEPLGVIDHNFHLDTNERIDDTSHCFLFEPIEALADTWTHHAEEEDMVFEYFWLPIDADLADRLHPHFAEVARRIAEKTLTSHEHG